MGSSATELPTEETGNNLVEGTSSESDSNLVDR